MKVLFIFGTRPEAIKMAPLIKALQSDKKSFETKVCVTGQHRQLLDQVLQFFEIIPDFDCNIMQKNQNLFDITSTGLKQLENVFTKYMPDIVLVQGDTTTAFTGALAAFYKQIKVAHLEAGLRSGDKYSPFPEEVNRLLIDHISDFHFAHSEKAIANLRREGISNNVWNTGNTVIDALQLGLQIIRENNFSFEDDFSGVNFSKRILLITCHRRESFGKPLEEICSALQEIAGKYSDCELIYPVHPNPEIRGRVSELLGAIKNIHLVEPVDYPHLIWLMSKSYLVLTDSGGIQEEAPALGKPVLVMREITERPEGIDAGCARLVGTSRERIVGETKLLLDSQKEYESMAHAQNPYGDGTSSEKISDIMRSLLL